MPRPRIPRRVCCQPNATYFKPAGVSMSVLEESVLSLDEVEAIRLKDLLGIAQEEAAERMGISQPTFHRLIKEARRKIADALINGKAMRIEGVRMKEVPDNANMQRQAMHRRRGRW